MTSPPLDDKRLAEIAERAEKATAGPWEFDLDNVGATYEIGFGITTARSGWTLIHIPCRAQDSDSAANGEFVAHARTDIPALVAEVRRLREALDEIRRIGEPRPDIHDAEDAANACIAIAEAAIGPTR